MDAMAPVLHKYIAMTDFCLERAPAEAFVHEQLKYAAVAGIQMPTLSEDLVAGTMKTGVVDEVTGKLWRVSHPGGSMAIATTASYLIQVAAGPGTSVSETGPAYTTTDIVKDVLEDVLFYRTEVARLSDGDDSFCPCFRAFRAYLSSSITAIDATLNRLAFYRLLRKGLSHKDEKLLKKRNLSLDLKLVEWLPLLGSKSALDQNTDGWTCYTAMRTARNEYAHVRSPTYAFSVEKAADRLNSCREGVGQLLLDILATVGDGHPHPCVYRVRHAPPAVFVARARPAGSVGIEAGPAQ
jgi:hypothetical protein